MPADPAAPAEAAAADPALLGMPAPPAAEGRRIAWAEVPSRVRSVIEQQLGSPVVSAVSQPGGFSPGSADRVVLADGRRAFVKAVGTPVNPDSPDIHRREIAVTAQLPASAPVPRLLGSYDDGEWVALVLEDVDGRTPPMPWRVEDLRRVVTALRRLAGTLTPSPLSDVPTLAESLAVDFTAWERLAAAPPDDLDPWAARHLDRLAALGRASLPAMAGDTLVHSDVRADNLLLTDHEVYVVDWPHACRGARWVDLVTFGVNVSLYGGHDPEAVLDGHPLLDGVAPEDVTAVLAGLAGYFAEACRRPPVPRMPTIRAFQRAQGEVTLAWVRRRTGWA